MNHRHADFQSAALPPELPTRKAYNLYNTNEFPNIRQEVLWRCKCPKKVKASVWCYYSGVPAKVPLSNSSTEVKSSGFILPTKLEGIQKH